MEETSTLEKSEGSRQTRLNAWLDWGSEYLGAGVLRLQLILIALSIAIWIFLQIAGAKSWLPGNLVFTLCVGNIAFALVYRARSLFIGKPPFWSWLIFIAVIIVVGITGSAIADVVLLLVFQVSFKLLPERLAADAPIGTLVTLIFSIISYRFEEQRAKLEARQRRRMKFNAICCHRRPRRSQDFK
jgi:hypothetical protein